MKNQPFEVFCPLCGALLFGTFTVTEVTVFHGGALSVSLSPWRIEHECKA